MLQDFQQSCSLRLRQGGSHEQENNVSGRRDGRGWTNGSSKCSTALSVESGFAANPSGRLASHRSNDDGPECFYEQKPPTEPVHLHGKILQPHPCKRDDGAPGLARGPDEGNCCSVVGELGAKWLRSTSRHIRAGWWKTHDARAGCKGYSPNGGGRI